MFCPAGSTPEFGPGDRTLRCAKPLVVEREAVCYAVNLPANGDIRLNTRIEHVTAGRDVCRTPGSSGNVATSAPQFVPLPGDPPASAFVQVPLPGKDVFRATVPGYVFPLNGSLPLYLNPMHQAANGVACPAGYDGDKVGNDRGIRCDRNDGAPKRADCDFPWSLLPDEAGREDRCVLANQRGQTKPVGMTFAQLQIEKALPTVGWVLNRNAGADTWQRRVYVFPNSR
ncbi:hypothetical protein ABXN37_12500 [Piscinibacter sakaiensis]|uniref:hypothetical protein n=1 Tax=Piscinibacter sakaiensis TaxID=1547922 RepID=UPI00372CA7E7